MLVSTQTHMCWVSRIRIRSPRRCLVRRSLLSSSTAAAPADRFRIQTFNAIAPEGLELFPQEHYDVSGGAADDVHAILLRSFSLEADDVPPSVRAVARCGAGTNNVPTAEMTARGIPVFNSALLWAASASSARPFTMYISN